MNKKVGCYTDEKLQELAEQPNTIVMQPTHDVIFEPWPASRVSHMMDEIIKITKNRSHETVDEIRNYCKTRNDISEFSEKYQKMFEKLTEPLFIQDIENVNIMRKLILLKAAVDKKITTNDQAQAEAADIALKSLVSRVKSNTN